MMVLVTYDVNTSSSAGVKRLRHVAKICLDYGQRVQNSVFECSLMPYQYVKLKNKLSKVIDKNNDSLRFYNLGKHWDNRVETIGKDESYNPDKSLLLF